jgi:Na+-transporting methylmalonyl-CoA/oxaloacetate decarboxylase gamma subunit
MTTEFQQGLLITAIGMGLVFVMIFVLWGLMAVLVRLTSKATQELATSEKIDVSKDVKVENFHLKEKVVAIAVAAALSISEKSTEMKIPVSQSANSWQTSGRIQQIRNRPRRR